MRRVGTVQQAETPVLPARPQHGGNIASCARELGVDVSDILDLSTGVSPFAYPLPAIPEQLLQAMPYRSEALVQAAAHYYGVHESCVLPVSGSQQAIQLLPQLYRAGTVLLPEAGYEEHCYCWRRAGHQPVFYRSPDREQIARLITDHQARALVLIHPNNPTGDYVTHDDVRYWRSLLPGDGVLLVDEAFIDPTPERSVSDLLPLSGLVILRSTGKFFGLPGLRLGFVLAAPALLCQLDEMIGPWAVNGVAQWAGERFLADSEWQYSHRQQLIRWSDAWQRDLDRYFAHADGRRSATPLFYSLPLPRQKAAYLQQQLKQRCVLVRHYQSGSGTDWLRVGLPADESQWQRLLLSLQESLK